MPRPIATRRRIKVVDGCLNITIKLTLRDQAYCSNMTIEKIKIIIVITIKDAYIS